MSSKFEIVEGDLAEAISATLVDGNGVPCDLTGAESVALKMWLLDRNGRTLETKHLQAEFVSKPDGQVKYQWRDDDTSPAGEWRGHWCVTFAGNKPLTFPSLGYFKISITAKVPE